MATFQEIEDMRDWSEDTLGEFLKRIDLLNGDNGSPPEVLAQIMLHAEAIRKSGLNLIKELERLLVQIKRDEFEP